MDHSSGFLNLVQDAKKRVRETTPETVRRRQETGERFHLVDVREDMEWERGHALGAIHIGKGIIERDIERAIPDRDEEIILYCAAASVRRSPPTLSRRWATGRRSMDGGWKRWRARVPGRERSRQLAGCGSDPFGDQTHSLSVFDKLSRMHRHRGLVFLAELAALATLVAVQPSAAPRPRHQPPIVSGR